MKNQEEVKIALRRVRNAVDAHKHRCEKYGGRDLEVHAFNGACEIAIACMELQIEKEPIRGTDDDGDRFFSCPSCGYDYLMVKDDYNREWHEMPYCGCGQKINWQEVKDDE